MTPAEIKLVELIMLEGAIENTKQYVALLQRRADHAYGEWHDAVKVLEAMQDKAKEMGK
jgi:hypothetical protein